MPFGCELDGLRCIWVGHRWWWLQLVGFGLLGGCCSGVFGAVLGCLGRLGCSGMSGPVWVIGPISLSGLSGMSCSLLDSCRFCLCRRYLSPLPVASAGSLSVLPLSLASLVKCKCKRKWKCKMRHARLLLARQVRWVGGMWDARDDDGICKTPAHETQLQQATTRILAKTDALDLISYPAAPQEGGKRQLASIQHPASSWQHPSIKQNKTKEGGCRTDDVGSGRLLEALQRPQLPCKEGKKRGSVG